MAKPMTADQTLAAMRKWHVPYQEYPGWKTRGRPASTGPFADVHGVMIHHTGSDAGQSDAYLKFLFVDGRSDLPAPLCHVSTDMDGDLHLGALGRANHAGKGSAAVLAHATNEDYGYTSELHPGPDAVDGNAHFYGNEVRYDGGQPMTAKQYAAATRWAAAVCDFHGWSALAIIGHREWTTRKPDPGHCPMNKFRSDVAALLKAGPPNATTPGITPPTLPAEAKDVTITASCIKRLANDHLGVSDACLVDNQQVMNIAAYFNPAMAETTRPYFWKMCADGNWAEAGKMMAYAVKVIQSKAGLPQDGVFGPKTGAFLAARGYTIK